jgi:hypothetical protein
MILTLQVLVFIYFFVLCFVGARLDKNGNRDLADIMSIIGLLVVPPGVLFLSLLSYASLYGLQGLHHTGDGTDIPRFLLAWFGGILIGAGLGYMLPASKKHGHVR